MSKSAELSRRYPLLPRLTLLPLALLAAACAGTQPPPAGPGTAPAACPVCSPCPAASPCPSPADLARMVGPKEVVLQNTPPITEALRETLARYQNVRSAAPQALSERGDAMLIATRFAQTAQLHRVDRPGGARTQLTFTAEPVGGAEFAPGSPAVVTYMSDVGGGEAYQIFRLELRTGRTTRLTDGKSRHSGYRWSHDGKQMAYTGNGRNGRDMDLYLGDGREAKAERRVKELSGYWYVLDWSPDDSTLLLGHYVSINDARLYTLTLDSGELKRISPEKPAASYRTGRFDASGKGVFLTSDRGGEFTQLYHLDLGKGRFTLLTPKLRWNVESLALSPDGGTLAFTANEDGYSRLYLLDTRRRVFRPVPKVPKGIIGGLSFARKARVLAFDLESPRLSGDAYTLDLRRGKGKLQRWTESELGGLDPGRLVMPEAIQYPTFDGRKIPAHYYRPPGAGPHPVLVWIHGGPEAQARPYFRGVLQYLVLELGIAVLMPNVRGSDGYGRSYLLLDNGFKREDSVKDIGALLDWVGRQKELNAERVAVFGGSYGGYMVLASLVHFGERLRAGVDIVGISNFVTFLENTKAYRRDLRRAEYGDERKPKMREFLQRISPSTSADKIRSALFVAHGANDPRVPLSETDQIVEAVKKTGQDVWYMVARNEGHGFRKKDNRDLFYQLTVLFLQKHLFPPKVTPGK